MKMKNLRYEQEIIEFFSLFRENKAISIPLEAFMDFKKALKDCFGSGGVVILSEMGKGHGIYSTKRLLDEHPNRPSLLEVITSYKQKEGWGNMEFRMKPSEAEVIITKSFEAEYHERSKEPVCHFLRGYLEGVISQIVGKEIKVSEIRCKATGNETCVFKIQPP
ncbi:V4R domain-containing protein [Candidatus Hecatella orcuttiae]|jgi:hypothetical protein|uniref:V4R domain-containing protein n=1 Tax=Candidatus Hecatella orcuttiae TaxID=1935119 RepID=UPI00286837DD|nr:V4R domain-containing protein [Candidatus Hecatella orcuttiae]